MQSFKLCGIIVLIRSRGRYLGFVKDLGETVMNPQKIALLTDSCADLSVQMVQEYHIFVVALKSAVGGPCTTIISEESRDSTPA